MKSSFQFEVKEPCLQNWDHMIPNEYGRFCSSCQLNVIDFTNNTPEEISNYLKENNGKQICGHIKRIDVKPQNKIDLFIFKLNSNGLKYISMLIFGILIITGCRSRKSTTSHVNGRILSDKNTNHKKELIQNNVIKSSSKT